MGKPMISMISLCAGNKPGEDHDSHFSLAEATEEKKRREGGRDGGREGGGNLTLFKGGEENMCLDRLRDRGRGGEKKRESDGSWPLKKKLWAI